MLVSSVETPKFFIEMESYSSALVQTVERAYQSLWEVRVLIMKARELLGQFPNLPLAHRDRKTNTIADWFAIAQ